MYESLAADSVGDRTVHPGPREVQGYNQEGPEALISVLPIPKND